MTRCSHSSVKGFTLIELMLAMAFIGMLLIVIASTSMFMMRAYTKGATIREVNQTGRTIIDDIQRTVAASSPVKISPVRQSVGDPADSKYVDKDGLGGRLCLGSYTYVWNYGSALASGDDVYNRYSDSSSDIRFAKVRDIGGNLCIDMESEIEEAQATELLTGGDRDLVIHNIKVEEGARQDVARQAMYSIHMRIGTNSIDQLDSSFSTCRPPSEGSGNEDFCAVNHFDIIVRAGSSPGSSQ